MEYAFLKALHILSATLLFGTGLGTAYFMWSANRTRDARVTASVARYVVCADWFFTLPTVIFQPLSGLWLMHMAQYPWNGWLLLSFALYAVAGLCWLPVVWLQLRMRDLAIVAVEQQTELPARYWQYARIWFWLGVPAFIAMVWVVFLMTMKPF